MHGITSRRAAQPYTNNCNFDSNTGKVYNEGCKYEEYDSDGQQKQGDKKGTGREGRRWNGRGRGFDRGAGRASRSDGSTDNGEGDDTTQIPITDAQPAPAPVVPEETVRLFMAAPVPVDAREVIHDVVSEFYSMQYPEPTPQESESTTAAGDESDHNTYQDAIKAAKKKKERFKINWVAIENFHITLRFIGNVSVSRIPELIDAIESQVRRGTRDPSCIRLQANGASSFPLNRLQPPRILYARIVEERVPSDSSTSTDGSVWTLHSIKRAVDVAIDNFLDVPADNSVFIPHITVGRCNAIGKSHDPIARAFLDQLSVSDTSAHISAEKEVKNEEQSSLEQPSNSTLLQSTSILPNRMCSEWFSLTHLVLYRSDTSGSTSNGVADFAGRSGSVYTPVHTFEL